MPFLIFNARGKIVERGMDAQPAIGELVILDDCEVWRVYSVVHNVAMNTTQVILEKSKVV